MAMLANLAMLLTIGGSRMPLNAGVLRGLRVFLRAWNCCWGCLGRWQCGNVAAAAGGKKLEVGRLPRRRDDDGFNIPMRRDKLRSRMPQRTGIKTGFYHDDHDDGFTIPMRRDKLRHEGTKIFRGNGAESGARSRGVRGGMTGRRIWRTTTTKAWTVPAHR